MIALTVLPWEEGFWPEWVWILMTNLGMLAAIVALVTALLWLWDHGPKLLIKYGPEWMTKLGTFWHGRREDKENGK